MPELGEKWKVAAAAIAVLAFLAYFVPRALSVFIPADLFFLPVLLFFSFYRLLIAYIFSLVFSLTCGYYAAKDPRIGNVLILVLDMLQSVPILGFFPAAVLIIVAAFGGSAIGIEAAAIFLIFTSMVWNMAFGVYESLTKMPADLKAVAGAFGLRRFKYFEKIVIPACIPNLVYNSTVSWANGWYFLIASEIISLGSARHSLPGIGSYLVQTTARGDLAGTFAGLAALVATVLALDLFVWRPLAVWSEKFRYDAPLGPRPHSTMYSFYKWSSLVRNAKKSLTSALDALFDEAEKLLDAHDRLRQNAAFSWLEKWSLRLALVAAAVIAVNIVAGLLILVYQTVTEPLPPQAYQIPLALVLSFGRLIAAYVISLLWTVPVAVYMAEHREAQRVLLPAFEVAAAVPATGLFPIIVLVIIQFTGDLNFASILLLLTGMQWYLLFNALIGARNLPSELETVAKAYRIRGWPYYRNFLLPVMMPSLITGTMVAFGGGWNALFVAEYIVYGEKAYSTTGMGSLLSVATYELGSFKLIFLTLAAMIISIFVVHRFVFRRLFNYAIRKFAVER